MPNYRIITDSCCDLPRDQIAKLDIDVVQMILNFRGEEVTDPSDEQIRTMYNALRAGENATTSAVNPETWKNAIEPVLANGQDALVLTFSSGLSTTYQSAVIAAEELSEAYPDRTVKVVDSLCASLGQGLFVWYACKKRDEGLSLEELTAWCESRKANIAHWFTVDDLMFLKRGGRISAATALVGTMLNIKPVLHVDDEGHLISVAKCRGRKNALEALAKKLETDGLPGENDTVFISHGDCLEDAEAVAKLVKERCGVKHVLISYVGAVIGSHSGPGTVAFFFLGKHR
jgi:DegV family protein with EDD domain